MQHFKQLKDLSIKDLMVENVEEDDPNMAVNLLTVASTGNAAFLEELLRAGLDPDIGDSKEKTPLVCPCLIIMILFIPFIFLKSNKSSNLLNMFLCIYHRYIRPMVCSVPYTCDGVSVLHRHDTDTYGRVQLLSFS